MTMISFSSQVVVQVLAVWWCRLGAGVARLGKVA
jgi:hypothetical protein